MGKIYIKQAGEDISSLKPIVTVGVTVPSDIAANDIVITDGEGSIQTSGVNINNIDAKTLNGLESTAFASSADIEKIVDGQRQPDPKGYRSKRPTHWGYWHKGQSALVPGKSHSGRTEGIWGIRL